MSRRRGLSAGFEVGGRIGVDGNDPMAGVGRPGGVVGVVGPASGAEGMSGDGRTLGAMSRRRLFVVGVVLALLAAGCSDAERPAETSAADAPVRATTTTAPPPLTLERVVVEPGVIGGDGDQRLTAVAAGVAPASGGRLVAVGSSGGRPAAWWSSDGRSWAPAPLGLDQFEEGATLADVAADPVGGGWVAVGGAGGGAAAWKSPDGVMWRRAQVDQGPPIDRVSATGAGFIAVAGGEQAAAWQSFSGDRWVRALDDPDVFGRPGSVRVAAVVQAGRQVQVVVDRSGQGPEIWRTDEGLLWSRWPQVAADLLPAAGTPGAGAALALGSALVVAGSEAKDDGTDAAVWLSTGPTGPFDQVPHDERILGGDGAQVVTGLAQDGDRLVVVGTETDDAGDLDAVVWESLLAGGLERAVDDGLTVPGDQHVLDVAVLGRTPVAVGWEETAAGVDAVAWVIGRQEVTGESEPVEGPALAWQRVTGQDALMGPGEQRMEAVTTLGGEGSGGWVVAGSGPGVDGDRDAAVWWSPDGWEWARAEQQGLGGPGDQQLLAVAGGPAGLVAVGTDGTAAAVWSSPDGASWERVAHDELVFGGDGEQRAEGVAALPGLGWVAVGSDTGAADGDAAVWLSIDGATWERVPGGEALGGPGSQAMSAVKAGASGLTAVGVDGGSAAAWVSTDGRSWSRSDLGPGQAAGLEAGEGGDVLAAGTVPGDGLDAAVWGLAQSWSSVEGGELSGPGDQGLAAVAFGEAIAVAVGHTDLGGGEDAAAWASTDGSTWRRSPHDENVFGGDQAQRMTGVATSGAMAVAVGWSGSAPDSRDAAVWVSDVRGGGGRSPL